MRHFGLRFTTGHLLWAATLVPAVVLLCMHFNLLWLGITLGVLIALFSVLAIRGRRLTGWIAAMFAWRRRHKVAPPAPSEPAVGATVMPGDHVAVRWLGDHLISVVELVPRSFTPTVIVNGEAFTDDNLDTRLVEQLLAAHGPDLEADIVSAGYRVGKTAPSSVVALYEQVVGPYAAPANRRTWIVLRANPDETRRSALRRGTGISGLASYLVATTTRIADQLASHGIDARPARSFEEYDRATAISFERETWSTIKGRSTFTAAYSAPGGPNMWWSARADHTITRVRVKPGHAPTATVLLTTLATPTTPRGFSCLFGGQRAALEGLSPITDRHYELPIGSAGVLVGRRPTGTRSTCRSTTWTPRSTWATRTCSRSSSSARRLRAPSSPWRRSSRNLRGSSTPGSGMFRRWCGPTPPPIWVHTRVFHEFCCATTLSTRLATVSCPSS